jgi:hypothetical protein
MTNCRVFQHALPRLTGISHENSGDAEDTLPGREHRDAKGANARPYNLVSLPREWKEKRWPFETQGKQVVLRSGLSKPHSKTESTDLKVGHYKGYGANAQPKQRADVRQAADLRFDRRHCQAAWARAIPLRILLPRRNVQVFRLEILSQME